jgi:membrane protein YdbS with pleckstrin-like domain
MDPNDSRSPRHRREADDGDYSDSDVMGYDSEEDQLADATTQPIPQVDDEDDDDYSVSAQDVAGLHYTAAGASLGNRRGPTEPVQGKASALVERYLFPTERFRGEWRKHWSYLADQFLIGAAATFFFGWLWGYLEKNKDGTIAIVVIGLWLVTMLYVAMHVADWYYDRFILTNKRIMKVSGMFSRTVAMMPLLRVTDMKYEQTPLGRLLHYGTFVLESAGQEQALREVKHLPNPNELYLRIVEEMYEPEAVEDRIYRYGRGDNIADMDDVAGLDGWPGAHDPDGFGESDMDHLPAATDASDFTDASGTGDPPLPGDNDLIHVIDLEPLTYRGLPRPRAPRDSSLDAQRELIAQMAKLSARLAELTQVVRRLRLEQRPRDAADDTRSESPGAATLRTRPPFRRSDG